MNNNKRLKNCVAIVLAAGMGKRLCKTTENTPKPLLEVGGKTLIEYAVDFVKKIGIGNIIIVGGYQYDKLKLKINSVDLGIDLVNNVNYDKQNLLSFYRALENIDENKNILVCNADYIFKDNTAKKVSRKLKGINVYCSFDLSGNDEDVMKVKIDSKGCMIEMSKQLDDFDAIYTGIFFLDSNCNKNIRSLVTSILNKYDNDKTTVEYIFGELKGNGYDVNVVDIGRADWFEIDTEEELEIARNGIVNS
jgi:choline kinase